MKNLNKKKTSFFKNSISSNSDFSSCFTIKTNSIFNTIQNCSFYFYITTFKLLTFLYIHNMHVVN